MYEFNLEAKEEQAQRAARYEKDVISMKALLAKKQTMSLEETMKHFQYYYSGGGEPFVVVDDFSTN